MTNTRNKFLQDFFKIYISYLEVELCTSILENSPTGRNADVIRTFQDTFYALIHFPLNEADSKKLIETLAKVKTTYIIETLGKRASSPRYINDIDKINEVDITKFFDSEFLNMLEIYYIAYRDFLQGLHNKQITPETKQAFCIDNSKGSVFIQALLEFNNALAHIAIVIYNNNDTLRNIEKAKNHIYRATLDCYKMLLRFVLPNISKGDKLIYTYEALRIDEFLMLGKDVNMKKKQNQNMSIIERYKELYNECVQKLTN